MRTFESNLEIIGSNDQIKEVWDFIKGEEVYIDFSKIIAIPEELDYSCDSLGGFVHSLLFGNTPGFDYEEEDDYGNEDSDFKNKKCDYHEFLQKKFKKLSDNQKCEGFEKALKYQSNLEKYGGLDNYHWRLNNWGTPFNVSSQWIISENKIGFITEEYPAKKLIVKLSEIFPQVVFNLSIIDPLDHLEALNGCVFDTYVYSIINGQYNYYLMNEESDKIFIYSSLYQKVDNLIKMYRENKLNTAC